MPSLLPSQRGTAGPGRKGLRPARGCGGLPESCDGFYASFGDSVEVRFPEYMAHPEGRGGCGRWRHQDPFNLCEFLSDNTVILDIDLEQTNINFGQPTYTADLGLLICGYSRVHTLMVRITCASTFVPPSDGTAASISWAQLSLTALAWSGYGGFQPVRAIGIVLLSFGVPMDDWKMSGSVDPNQVPHPDGGFTSSGPNGPCWNETPINDAHYTFLNLP